MRESLRPEKTCDSFPSRASLYSRDQSHVTCVLVSGARNARLPKQSCGLPFLSNHCYNIKVYGVAAGRCLCGPCTNCNKGVDLAAVNTGPGRLAIFVGGHRSV